MWKEFKEFALKGNVLDMAVGVVVGGAFSQIVTSLVNDVIMPVMGLLTGGADFKTLKIVLSPAVVENGIVVKAESALMYGNFLQNVVDFLIIAMSIFLFVKLINKMRNLRARKEEIAEQLSAEQAAPKGPSSEELLTEIRDLLRAQHGTDPGQA